MSLAIVEPQQNTAETPQTDAQAFLEPSPSVRPCSAKQRAAQFTSANAKEMQARSIALRKARVEALRAAADPTTQPEDEYRKARLKRTRTQLEALDKQLEAAAEPRDVKAIADAIARLSEVERILAGRPAPGAYRPVREKVKRAAAGAAGPLDAETE